MQQPSPHVELVGVLMQLLMQRLQPDDPAQARGIQLHCRYAVRLIALIGMQCLVGAPGVLLQQAGAWYTSLAASRCGR